MLSFYSSSRGLQDVTPVEESQIDLPIGDREHAQGIADGAAPPQSKVVPVIFLQAVKKPDLSLNHLGLMVFRLSPRPAGSTFRSAP